MTAIIFRRYLRFALLGLAATALTMLPGCGSGNPDPRPQLQVVEQLRLASMTAGGGTQEAPAEAAPIGWGTLTGKFVLQGSPPDPKSLEAKVAAGDVAACGQHPIPNDTLVIGDGGGIANVLVFVRKFAGKPHPDSKKLAGQPAVFDQKECRFLSRVLVVQVGQQVIVKNSDPVGHNTNISPASDNSFNPLIPGGGSATYQFSRPQAVPVPVSCNIHPWMRAYILPRKDPYAAATGPDGSFKLENVPAGQGIELSVWHEKGAGDQGGLSAGPIQGGRLKVTVDKDGTKDLGTIEVPLSAFRE